MGDGWKQQGWSSFGGTPRTRVDDVRHGADDSDEDHHRVHSSALGLTLDKLGEHVVLEQRLAARHVRLF